MSEFGRGLAYNLGLFLAHAEGLPAMIKEYRLLRQKHPDNFTDDMAAHMWFYGAGDHIFELQIDSAPKTLHDRLINFKNLCLHCRNVMSSITADDCTKAIKEAKALLLELDKAHGIDAEKGEWE